MNQFIWRQTVNLFNTHCSVEDNYTVFFPPTNKVCLVVIFNSKTRYPKGAVQQMEVEIAALYNTMHINLQWTDWSKVWSWGYGFKYGYWLIMYSCLSLPSVSRYTFVNSLLCSVLLFSLQSFMVFYSKSGISESKVKRRH